MIIPTQKITNASLENRALPIHILNRRVIEDISQVAGIPDDQTGFRIYAEIDTAMLLKSEGPYFVRISDAWTSQPVGSFVRLDATGDRVIRAVGGNLDSGIYSFNVYTREGRLLWSSIVRARANEHQIIVNK